MSQWDPLADDVVEQGLRNYFDGDRSWWTRLRREHRNCGGIFWQWRIVEDQQQRYSYVVCEKCQQCGTFDAFVIP